MNALRPFGAPAGVDPAEWRAAVAARIDQLHDAMLALIAVLDLMDGDPDLEDSGDLEPSLGARLVGYDRARGPLWSSDELEGEDTDREPDCPVTLNPRPRPVRRVPPARRFW